MSSCRFGTIGLIVLSSRARGKEKTSLAAAPPRSEGEQNKKPACVLSAGRFEFGGVGTLQTLVISIFFSLRAISAGFGK